MASPLVAWGVPLFAAALANGFVFLVYQAEAELRADARARQRRVTAAALGVFAWMGFCALLALGGTLSAFAGSPWALLLVLASAPALALGVGASRIGERLARGLPLVTLVAVQGFRVPFELMLYQATRDGLMPVSLSYAGYNYEIVSGVTAALLGGLLALGRVPWAIIVLWNVLGAALLVTAGVLTVAASPSIQAFGRYQVNAWIARFPYVWVVVPWTAAALGHVVLTRRLWLDLRRAAPRTAQGSR